jgi:hypothetical protein
VQEKPCICIAKKSNFDYLKLDYSGLIIDLLWNLNLRKDFNMQPFFENKFSHAIVAWKINFAEKKQNGCNL